MHRVMHVITGLSVGGAEMALYRLATCNSSDYRHAVVSLTTGGGLRKQFIEAGVDLVTFDFKKAPISQFWKLVLLIRRERPDIVQTWMYHADLIGGLAARIAGIDRVVWGVHSTRLVRGSTSALTPAVRRVCAWLSRVVPSTIVCVAEAARRAHLVAGYDSARMVVVPNGFDLSRFTPATHHRAALRSRYGIADHDILIGTVARFNPVKDPKNFVDAAGTICARHPEARFVMIGKGMDASNTTLMAWIERTGHRHRFLLLGERSDVVDCYAAMDAFCLHSRSEAFPLAVGEAMAMELPCVVTDVGDASLMVGDTGVVVSREDPAALARGLENLLALSADERRRMGQRARARIEMDYSMERARERFETIYRQTVAEGVS
ncbi:glycosyltransferase family 4 protein [Noviherbaspirillum sp. ST9]|uniref:glycosyltransferase family 4 protein n=1 Tax=Noviherbaspirillum sp. ST9 TaxID=3401606 RepID=UPI003B58A1C4